MVGEMNVQVQYGQQARDLVLTVVSGLETCGVRA